MSVSPGFKDFLLEQLRELGEVQFRRMFGGGGLFKSDLMFAIVADDVLYLKTDEHTRADFEALGLGPFIYGTKNGPKIIKGYWRAPAHLLDEPEELTAWCSRAFDVAVRAHG